MMQQLAICTYCIYPIMFIYYKNVPACIIYNRQNAAFLPVRQYAEQVFSTMRQVSWDKKAEITNLSHPPEKVPILLRSKKPQRELTSINIVTIASHVKTYIQEWAWPCSVGDRKMGELAVLWKKCPDFSACVHPFLHN